MTVSVVRLADPYSDQTVALVRLLRSAGVPVEVDPEDNEDAIPTTAVSTWRVLQEHDIVCGKATLTRQARTVFAKEECLLLVSAAGVPVPATRSGEDLSGLHYPVFYKEAFEGGFGRRRGVAEAADELPRDRSGLIVQEFVDGEGTYGVAFVAIDGEIRHSSAHWEVTSVPRTGGSAVTLRAIYNERLLYLTALATRALRYSGWGLAEFKYDHRRGDFVFMEINAKFWASCEFSFRNNPAMFVELFGKAPALRPLGSATYVHRLLTVGPSALPGYLRAAKGSTPVIYSSRLTRGIRRRVLQTISGGRGANDD